jgi:hypothetical protein
VTRAYDDDIELFGKAHITILGFPVIGKDCVLLDGCLRGRRSLRDLCTGLGRVISMGPSVGRLENP